MKRIVKKVKTILSGKHEATGNENEYNYNDEEEYLLLWEERDKRVFFHNNMLLIKENRRKSGK
jgi:hypothetical protein